MPFGAEVQSDGSVRFRLWAPAARSVALSLENSKTMPLPLPPAGQGWFEITASQARAGSLYRFQIDGKTLVPDPAARFEPHDAHGPSEVIDPSAFDWNDGDWRGRPWEEASTYELHVGTFTPEGTFGGAEQKLEYLRDLGITAIELMPLSDFSGARNWGYDGVLPFAPDSSYGRPEDLKQLIQSAHAKGLMVFLDVVYNHFGPDGNYLRVYAPQFFTDRHKTPWGDAINFDGPESRTVRDFFIHNALYWLEEYHFDGLRLDAGHALVDDSTPDILTELATAVRDRFGEERFIHLILENDANIARYLQRDKHGAVRLYNAQWNDDIHHALHVLLTGESDGYYADYVQDPMRHLCRCLRDGFAYQGEYSEYHASHRGEPSADLPPSAFVCFMQNHDQIGNRALGERISQLAEPKALKAAMEILLLAPSPPLLFMGEEFAANTPFLFFCDFQGDLAAAVTQGRRNEFARFSRFNSVEARSSIPDPNAEQTFQQSKLDWNSLQVDSHSKWLHLYRELLSLRQRMIVPRAGITRGSRGKLSGAYKHDLSIDWFFEDGAQLELRANLGSLPGRKVLRLSGAPFYSSNAEATEAIVRGNLPAWSVVWSLRA